MELSIKYGTGDIAHLCVKSGRILNHKVAETKLLAIDTRIFTIIMCYGS